jgi:hypothetical protein
MREARPCHPPFQRKADIMKSIALWLVGVPITLIILLNVFGFLS